MSRHARIPSLDCAAMRLILAAPAEDPADTDTILAALGRRHFRVLLALGRLERSGWVVAEKAGRDRLYRPAYAPSWYEQRIAS